ncbi:MAG: amidohydrolase, partial [Clostridia bacterium]
MSKFLLKNCDIANFETLGFSRKDILIDCDKIKKIADKIEDVEATVIDANGMMTMPAFVDCHTHMRQTFLKGYMDDFTITEWLVR